jgi:hypothetical protein
MTHSSVTHNELHQLRFVFEHSIPLLRYVPAVTSGDIARIWNEIAQLHPEPPVAIDVTFAPSQKAERGRQPALTG